MPSAFRASLYGACDGVFWPQHCAVLVIGAGAPVVGKAVGHWRVRAVDQWRRPLDIE